MLFRIAQDSRPGTDSEEETSETAENVHPRNTITGKYSNIS